VFGKEFKPLGVGLAFALALAWLPGAASAASATASTGPTQASLQSAINTFYQQRSASDLAPRQPAELAMVQQNAAGLAFEANRPSAFLQMQGAWGVHFNSIVEYPSVLSYSISGNSATAQISDHVQINYTWPEHYPQGS